MRVIHYFRITVRLRYTFGHDCQTRGKFTLQVVQYHTRVCYTVTKDNKKKVLFPYILLIFDSFWLWFLWIS